MEPSLSLENVSSQTGEQICNDVFSLSLHLPLQPPIGLFQSPNYSDNGVTQSQTGLHYSMRNDRLTTKGVMSKGQKLRDGAEGAKAGFNRLISSSLALPPPLSLLFSFSYSLSLSSLFLFLSL